MKVIPENVLVAFGASYCLITDPTPWFEVSITAASLGLQNPTQGTKVIKDSAMAIFQSDDDTPVNQEELQALARQLAVDYYNWIIGEYDVVYDGVVSWSAESLTDCVEYAYDSEEITTRVLTGPINSSLEEFLHGDIECCPMERWITRVVCEEGKLNAYGVNVEIEQDKLLWVGEEQFLYQAGCCACHEQFCETVHDCHGHGLSGASVTVTAGSATVSGTTDGTGKVCFDVNDRVCTVTTAASGYNTQVNTVTVSGATNVTVNLVPTVADWYQCIWVYGCGTPAPRTLSGGLNGYYLPDGRTFWTGLAPLPGPDASFPIEGATVTFDGHAVTTDSNGMACYRFTNLGTYTVSFAARHYLTASTTINVNSNCYEGKNTVIMAPDSGRFCCGFANLPESVTLSAGGGSCVATYSGGSGWTCCLLVPGATIPATCVGSYTCPTQTTGSTALTTLFDCMVDYNNNFLGIRGSSNYLYTICESHYVNNKPVCDMVYYNSSVCPTSTRDNCVICPSPGFPNPILSLCTYANMYFTVPVTGGMSLDPFDFSISLSAVTAACTDAYGNIGTPVTIPPPAGSITVSE